MFFIFSQFQIQLQSKHLQHSMFKVVDGVVEALASPFSNREGEASVHDIALNIPGQDSDEERQGPNVIKLFASVVNKYS